ncbi:MAG: TDP-N-acetylfucosamine:lipid II N-acetylfucosaminyltransferase [Flexilinea sp.]
MNIHFMQDQKFIDSFIELYSSTHLDTESVFFICLHDTNNDLIYVKDKKVKKICLNVKTWNKIKRTYKKIDNIYLHALSENLYTIISLIPKETKIYWIFYGYEIYQNVLFTRILDNNSENIYPEIYKCKGVLRLLPLKVIKVLLRSREKIRICKLKRILPRIDYFCHWNKIDYEYIKELFPEFTAKYIPFEYNSQSKIVISSQSSGSNKKNTQNNSKKKIMLGHNASIALNHVTILNFLCQFDKNLFEIICPVSYGDLDYKNYLIKYARKHHMTNLVILEKFIPLQNYADFISQIDVLIMNNIRTQGAGNVSLAIKMGKKVYLNPKNTHYTFLKKQGYAVYSIDKLFHSSIDEILSPLEDDQINRNKTVDKETTNDHINMYGNLP